MRKKSGITSNDDKGSWTFTIDFDKIKGKYINTDELKAGKVGKIEWSNSQVTGYVAGAQCRSLLQELINTPILKIPFWIESHKKELEDLGLIVNETKLKEDK